MLLICIVINFSVMDRNWFFVINFSVMKEKNCNIRIKIVFRIFNLI